MAVAFGTVGTLLTGSASTTASIPVPASVATNDIILAVLYVENGTETVTPPSGFTEATASPATEGGGFPGRTVVHAFWKRQTSATGAGETTGTYAFTIAAGLDWRDGYAARFTGCITSGNPIDAAAAAAGSTTVADVGPVTTTVANTLLVWVMHTFDDGRSPTLPTGGWTNLINGTNYRGAYKAQAASGSSGTVTGSTMSIGNTGTGVWLGALKPPGGAAAPVAPGRGINQAVRRSNLY